MTDKGPTYKQRAVATSVNNVAGLRDLTIDLAAEIDRMLDLAQLLPVGEEEPTEAQTETEGN